MSWSGPSNETLVDEEIHHSGASRRGLLAQRDRQGSVPRDALAPAERARRLRENAGSPPQDVAKPSFLLARALWRSRVDRPRAESLAREAQAAFEAADEREEAAEVHPRLESH